MIADAALSVLALVGVAQLYVALRDREAVDPPPDFDPVGSIESDELSELRIKARAFDSIAIAVEKRPDSADDAERQLKVVTRAVIEASVDVWLAVDPNGKAVAS